MSMSKKIGALPKGKFQSQLPDGNFRKDRKQSNLYWYIAIFFAVFTIPKMGFIGGLLASLLWPITIFVLIF